MAATVENRFSKNLPKGGSLCGVFTREYRHEALNSQVGHTLINAFVIELYDSTQKSLSVEMQYLDKGL